MGIYDYWLGSACLAAISMSNHDAAAGRETKCDVNIDRIDADIGSIGSIYRPNLLVQYDVAQARKFLAGIRCGRTAYR